MVNGMVTMTSADFVAWCNRMGFGKRDAARALGCDRDTTARYWTGAVTIPHPISLACAALEHLPPIILDRATGRR